MEMAGITRVECWSWLAKDEEPEETGRKARTRIMKNRTIVAGQLAESPEEIV